MCKIVGQLCLQNKLLSNPLFHFTLLTGPKGSGKRTISKWLAEELKIPLVEYGGSVDDIRDLIDNCFSSNNITLYYIDGDSLTIQAQNALLKLAEEPPNRAYIIIGVSTLDVLLQTIRSRARSYAMDPYSYMELREYANKCGTDSEYLDSMCYCSTNPGMINDFMNCDFDGLYKYTFKVMDNILKVSTGNAFKIINKISVKDGTDGYPVILFLELFRKLVAEDRDLDTWVAARMVDFTTAALMDMRIKGANKSLIFDIWVLNIRTLR